MNWNELESGVMFYNSYLSKIYYERNKSVYLHPTIKSLKYNEVDE